MEEGYRNRNSAHPLLRGGKAYPHGFSFAEMESLAAVCDTFIASLSSCNGYSSKETEQDFDSISGSQDGLPGYIAGLFATHCPTAALVTIRFVLLCLYTRLGTLLFCGKASLSKSFPYVRNFADIPILAREKAVLKWSLGTGSIFYPLLRSSFIAFKTYSLYAFYSREKKPLDGGIIDAFSASWAQLQAFLRDAGFRVTAASHKLNHIRSKIGKGSDIFKVRLDEVVVGSGAGGGVVAGKLAQAGYKVLVVEKGNYFTRGDLWLMEGPSLDQMYARGGLLKTIDGSVSILAGATVGGGSAIKRWKVCS